MGGESDIQQSKREARDLAREHRCPPPRGPVYQQIKYRLTTEVRIFDRKRAEPLVNVTSAMVHLVASGGCLHPVGGEVKILPTDGEEALRQRGRVSGQ